VTVEGNRVKEKYLKDREGGRVGEGSGGGEEGKLQKDGKSRKTFTLGSKFGGGRKTGTERLSRGWGAGDLCQTNSEKKVALHHGCRSCLEWLNGHELMDAQVAE